MSYGWPAGSKPVPFHGVLQGTGDQELLSPAPSATYVRCLVFLQITNTYTAQITVTPKLLTKQGATRLFPAKVLAVGEAAFIGGGEEEIGLDDDTSLVASLGAEAEKADFVGMAWDVPA